MHGGPSPGPLHQRPAPAPAQAPAPPALPAPSHTLPAPSQQPTFSSAPASSAAPTAGTVASAGRAASQMLLELPDLLPGQQAEVWVSTFRLLDAAVAGGVLSAQEAARYKGAFSGVGDPNARWGKYALLRALWEHQEWEELRGVVCAGGGAAP